MVKNHHVFMVSVINHSTKPGWFRKRGNWSMGNGWVLVKLWGFLKQLIRELARNSEEYLDLEFIHRKIGNIKFCLLIPSSGKKRAPHGYRGSLDG